MKNHCLDIWSDLPYDESPAPGFRPVMDTYILEGQKIRGAVLVLPGGGYGFTSEREGEPIANQFAAAGFHAFVLWYSVAPHAHPQPILDVSRALCVIRENAAEWRIDPDKIAVAGFSAGGHLAASIGVHWDKPWLSGIRGLSVNGNKPNALILSYPVITSGPLGHRGSFENLLGLNPRKTDMEMMSLENQVGAQTPPTFLWHTFEDEAVPVENSLLFASALRQAGVPFEMHVYPEGRHGLSLASVETAWEGQGVDPHVGSWIRLCAEWLAKLFL